MFEIKITLTSSKENANQIISPNNEEILNPNKLINITNNHVYNDNSLYETISGHLQIMRVKSDNISLTDKYEFFRFLPILRSNIILVLAIPDQFQQDDFIHFIKSQVDRIRYVKFLNDYQFNSNNSTFLRAILFFDSQDSADNFYYEFNTKSFPNKFENLYCFYINKIYYEYSDKQITRGSYFQNISCPVFFDPNKQQSELFCCPLCLEKLDTANSGIHTIVNLMDTHRWENYKKFCCVCSKFYYNNLIECLKCKNQDNIWCCMICGFTGCDRYQKGHAVEHFNNTLHRYSIDLASQRIWDYLGDGWVHRMIKIENNKMSPESERQDTIYLEQENNEGESNLNTKEFLIRIENIISEYNYVLASQLEEQRKYYDREITRVNEINEQKLVEKHSIVNKLQEELNSKKVIIENNLKFEKECKKKLNKQDKSIKETEDKIKLTKESISNLKEDIEKNKNNTNKRKPNNSKYIDLLNSKIRSKEELQKKLEQLYNNL